MPIVWPANPDIAIPPERFVACSMAMRAVTSGGSTALRYSIG